jgi:hypothetical protein
VRKINYLLFAMLGTAVLMGITSRIAQAQSVPSTGDDSVYFVTYYSNNVAAAPDATVRIINDGGFNNGGGPSITLTAGIYVFDDSEELTECCYCDVTPDGLLSENVKTQLTANPITGKVPTRGVIKMISYWSTDNVYLLEPGLRAWATHIQPASKNAYSTTETKFANANLTGAEETLLQNLCYYDGLLSGQPCTCTPEDHDF